MELCVFIDCFNFFPLRCAVISSIPAGATYTFKCSGMEGRYVNIVIPGKKKILTLSEVEVYGASFVKYIPSGKYTFIVSNDNLPLFCPVVLANIGHKRPVKLNLKRKS